jgi:hypothetical protein
MVFDVSDPVPQAPSDSDSHIMIPLSVLAERKSHSGESEVLVVWQPNRIPAADMAGMQTSIRRLPTGFALQVLQHDRQPHCARESSTKLAEDVAIVADKASKQISKFRTDMAGASAPQIVRVLKAAVFVEQDAALSGRGCTREDN